MDNGYNFTAESGGIRLDRFISDKYPELSRTQVQKLIADGYVTVNSRRAKASYKVNTGDGIEIMVTPPPPSPIAPEAMLLKIVYEDADLLVVDKPAGLTVHPAPGHPGHTLVNAILAHYPALAEIGNSPRPGIVHRLDKDTSGLMVVAKNRAAQLNLANQFKSHMVTKIYQSLVRGRLTPGCGIIEAEMGRDPHDRKKMAVVSRGRESSTEYRILRYIGNHSLLELKLRTGRTHQIRVHLAAIGFPVVGDTMYGMKSPYLARQFLHACKLGFSMPSTGEYIEFISELPADLTSALKAVEREADWVVK
ncbi:MAG: RluA family pseudouridine synthase [Dehalococcoidales bacterium]|nr:RluA family pseudouridine synthase [Dehalococcoidales bacterium]